MMPMPNQVWLVVEAIDMRAGIDSLSQRIQNTLGPLALRRQRLRLPQSTPQSAPEAPDLGWHRCLALPAAPASRSLHLAERRYSRVRPDASAMAMAGERRRLAAPGRRGAGPLAGLNGALNRLPGAEQISLKPMFARLSWRLA